MLNSFWGKFGQISNMPQIKYISEPAEYFDMLTSHQILVMDINFVSRLYRRIWHGVLIVPNNWTTSNGLELWYRLL
jgi:hypothetical protein